MQKFIIILIIVIVAILIIFSVASLGYFSTLSDSSSSEIPKIKTTFTTEKELQNQQVKNFKTDDPTVNFLLSECGLDEHCLAEEVRNVSNEVDEKRLWEVINLTMSSYETLGIWCHHQGHHVGEFLLGYYNGDIQEALSNAHRKCDSSLYHGMLENFIKQEVILSDVDPKDIEVTTSCDIFEDRLIRLECGHGIGHGLVKASDFDLKWSANRCDEFELTEQRQVCYRGVFMENIVALEDGKGVFDEDDPYSVCNTLEDRHAQVCYQYHAKKINSFTPGNVFDSCDKIEPESLVKYCYMGVQPYLFSTFHNNYQNIVLECSKGNLDYQTYCYVGTVIGLIDWKGTKEGITFCEAIPEEFKPDCYDYLGKMVHDESPDRVEEECSKAESIKYQNICRDADPEGIRILIT
jgi:hypothetical protein